MTRCAPRTPVSASKIAIPRDAALGQQPGARRSAGFAGNGDEQVLRADEVVLETRRFGLRQVDDQLQSWGHRRLRAAVGLRDLGEQLARAARDTSAGSTFILRSSAGHDAVLLLDERDEQMLGLDLRVVQLLARAAARRRSASCAFSVNLFRFMTQLTLPNPSVPSFSRRASASKCSRCSGESVVGSCTSTVA